jgi:hypothetical protein
MKTQYVESLVVEVMMTYLSKYHGAYGGGADDRVEWRGRTGGSSIFLEVW